MPETIEAPHPSTSLSFTSNFPVPLPTVCQGDNAANWEFFRQQWKDYEVATGLNQRDCKITALLKCGSRVKGKGQGSRVKGKGQEQGSRVRVKGKGQG